MKNAQNAVMIYTFHIIWQHEWYNLSINYNVTQHVTEMYTRRNTFFLTH